MQKYSENDRHILLKILALSEDTSPVKLSLGYTSPDGQCRHGIVIKDAASCIVKELVNDERVVTTSLEYDGLHIMTKGQ